MWQQFRLIDKTYVIVYIMAVFAGFALMVFLQYAGTGKNDAIMVSMIISGCLSTLSVWGINKLYFGKMAELGATCYFDTRMCAAAGLMVIESVNFTVIMLLALYSGNTWEVSNLQTVIYILTATTYQILYISFRSTSIMRNIGIESTKIHTSPPKKIRTSIGIAQHIAVTTTAPNILS